MQEALDIARRNREKRSEARAVVNLGSIRIQTGNAEQGWHDVQAALAYYREGSYHTEAALALVLLGRASRNHGDYDAARRAFDGTLATLKNDGVSLPMALAQEGLASLDELQDFWPQALKKYEDTRCRGRRENVRCLCCLSAASLNSSARFVRCPFDGPLPPLSSSPTIHPGIEFTSANSAVLDQVDSAPKGDRAAPVGRAISAPRYPFRGRRRSPAPEP
jgi:tetratricopeptide (TPR) repeat protein